jgi:hypothetical protein
MLKALLLGLTMFARIILAWGLGLLILWALAISGMDGMEPANWLTVIVASASAPIMILAVIVCLSFPSLVCESPIRVMFYAVALAMLISAYFGGLLSGLYAVFAAVPSMILFLLSLLILPVSRTRKWFV